MCFSCFSNYDLTGRYVLHLYITTQVRAIPYLIGIIVGNLIFMHDESNSPKKSCGRKIELFFWLYSIGHLLSPVLVKFIILNRSLAVNVFLDSYGRTFWSLSVSWIILGCHYEREGLINRFLSSKFWIPFGKLGLSIYLVHPIVQYNLVAFSGKQTNFESFFIVRLLQKSFEFCKLTEFTKKLYFRLKTFLLT